MGWMEAGTDGQAYIHFENLASIDHDSTNMMVMEELLG